MRRPLLLLLAVASLARANGAPAAALPRIATRTLVGDELRAWPRRAAWDALAARGSGAWSAIPDARTLAPAIAWGRGIPLWDEAPADLAAADAIVRRDVLEPHRALFGIDPASLVLDEDASGSSLGGAIWSIDYVASRDGVRVEGSRLGVRIERGRLVMLGSRLLVEPPPSLPAPSLTAAQALRIAAPAGELLDATLVLVPQAAASGVVLDASSLAWRVRFRAGGTWIAWVRAGEPASVIALESADARACDPAWPRRGVVLGGVLPESPLDAEIVVPFPFASLDDGRATGRDGGYVFDGAPSASSLRGRHVAVACGDCASPAAARAVASASGAIDFGTGGSDVTGNGVSTRAERGAFVHAERARELASEWIDPATTPWLDDLSRVVVNDRSAGECTSWWDGEAHLSPAGAGCANAAETASLVAHEWAHGLDAATGGGADRARDEGFADLVAMLLARRPEIAPGYLPTGPLRCLDWRACDEAPAPLGTPLTVANVATFCPSGEGTPLGREMHCEGQLLGQSGFDLVGELRASVPEWTAWRIAERLVLGGALSCDTSLPDDVGGAYWAFVLADDDDADLSNGTPHGGEIWRAFDAHGLAPADCGTHAGCLLPNVSSARCTRPATPVATATASLAPDDGSAQVSLDWPADSAVASWSVFRSDFAQDDAYLPIAGGLVAPGFVDRGVVAGESPWYAVMAVAPSGCESDAAPVQAIVALPRLALDASSVTDDTYGDADGVAEPGERIEVLASIVNRGQAGASGIRATLVSDDPDLVVTQPAAAAPDLAPDAIATLSPAFTVDVAAGAACAPHRPLVVILESADGCWRAEVPVSVGSGRSDARVDGVFAEDSLGNSNAIAEPGEQADVAFAITASGLEGLTGATLTATTSDPLVTLSGSASLPSLLPGATNTSSPLQATIDPAHPCPADVPVTLRIVAAEGCFTRQATLPIGSRTVVFGDDFSTDRGWTWGAPGDTADDGAFARADAAVTGHVESAGDPERGDLDGTTSLTSPPIDLVGETDAVAAWSASFSTTDASGSDVLRLLARSDAGAWIEAWREASDAPARQRHSIDLASVLGAPLGLVELRFEATGDPAHVVEAEVDDVAVDRRECDAPAPRPDLALDSVRIDDGLGLGHGNGNGRFDPGESVVIVPTLVSTGAADAIRIAVSLRLVSAPPGAILVSGSATVRDLVSRDISETDDPHLRVRLDPSTPCGSALDADLLATFEDASGASFTRRLGRVRWDVGTWSPAPCDPFTDASCLEPIVRAGAVASFEGPGDGGWSHGGALDEWERGAPVGLADDPPAAASGSACFGADLGLVGDGRYEPSSRSFLESPAWDASRLSHVHLRFHRWLGVQGSEADRASISVNGAEVWANASPGPLYDDECADPFGARARYFSDAEGTADGAPGWKSVDLDASGPADHRAWVIARWELDADALCSRGGWSIDDVELVGARDHAACTPHVPCDASFLAIDAGPDGVLGCRTGPAPLSGRILVADGPFGADVSWSPTTGVADPTALATTTTEAGVYVLTVTDRTTGCTRSDTALVTDTRNPPSISVSQGGPLTCSAPSALLAAAAFGGDGSMGYRFAWTPAGDVADPSAATTTTSVAGVYTCTVTDVATGCPVADSVTVTSDQVAPSVSAGPDLDSACSAAVTLQGAASGGNGTQGYDVAWSPAAPLDDATSLTPTTNVPGDYVLTVTDRANGCVATDVVTVTASSGIPPTPVGDALRVRRSAIDVVLDLGLHAGADAYRAYRSGAAPDLVEPGLDATSPALLLDSVPGPLLTDAGAAAAGAPRLLFYKVHAVNACGVEE